MDGASPPLHSKGMTKPSKYVLEAEEEHAEREQERVERALERRRRNEHKKSSKQDDTPSKLPTVPANVSTSRYLETAENLFPPRRYPFECD